MARNVLILLVLVLSLTSTALAMDRQVDAEADKLLKDMCSFMAATKAYTAIGHVLEDRVQDNGMKLKFSRSSTIAVNKPAQLRAETKGEFTDKLTVINGPKMSILDNEAGVYQEVEVPVGLAATMDHLLETYGVNVPTSDLLTEDPYTSINTGVITGEYVNKSELNGVVCHHLAFRQLDVDWEVWIQDGDKPLPLRLVITDKTKVGNPQYMLEFTDWNLQPSFADDTFEFKAPEGAEAGEILVIGESSEAN